MTSPEHGGWLLSGFLAQIVLWLWVGVVLAYGLIRSASNPDPDALRSSGPGED